MRRSAVAAALAAAMAMPAPADGQVLEPNPWLERRVLHIAHQGGELEAPSNTLFAFETAAAKGADVLDLDVHATADRKLVVIHDATVSRTTNGSGRVDEMTFEQIKALDAAYWFVPGCGTRRNRPVNAYVYRGLATGDRPMPPRLARFEPNDFRIPTLREVLERFPDRFINIEIKATAPDTEPYERELAELLAQFDRTDDTIVGSFDDHATELFKAWAPDVHTATGTGQTGLFWTTAQGPLPGAPNPRYQALQVPLEFQGLTIVTPAFVEKAHANGLAVHVWTIDDRKTMQWLVDIGVDGIMTDRPTVLELVLRHAGVRYAG